MDQAWPTFQAERETARAETDLPSHLLYLAIMAFAVVRTLPMAEPAEVAGGPVARGPATLWCACPVV